MSAAGFALLADAGSRRTLHPAVGYRFGGYSLACGLGGHDHVAGPIESQNLPVSIFEQSNCPDHALYDLDFLSLMLALPKERASTRNKRCCGLATVLSEFFSGQPVGKRSSRTSADDLWNTHLPNPH
jgi:hypothetical protein